MKVRYVVALCDRLGVTRSRHSTHDSLASAHEACLVAQSFCEKWRPWWRARVKAEPARVGAA